MTIAEQLDTVRDRAHTDMERRIADLNRQRHQEGREDRAILGIVEPSPWETLGRVAGLMNRAMQDFKRGLAKGLMGIDS